LLLRRLDAVAVLLAVAELERILRLDGAVLFAERAVVGEQADALHRRHHEVEAAQRAAPLLLAHLLGGDGLAAVVALLEQPRRDAPLLGGRLLLLGGVLLPRPPGAHDPRPKFSFISRNSRN